MLKNLLLVAVLAVAANAQSVLNYTGYADTSEIADFGADSLKYSKWFELSRYENGAVITFADDSSAVGFDNDSIKFQYGYQLGHIVLNSSGNKDTLVWPVRNIIDTFSTMGADTVQIGDTTLVMDSDMIEDVIYGIIDTTSVSGYAVACQTFTPAWAPLLRFWAKGLTGNNVADIKLRFAYPRRAASKVSER